MQNWKRAVISIILIFAAAFHVVCQEDNSLIFLGIFSNDADSNMLNMTEDFYYKQLLEARDNVDFKKLNLSLKDFENNEDVVFDEYETPYFFYAVIKKIASSRWETKFILRDRKTSQTTTVTKEYESYYKILMESKANFSAMISKLFTDKSQSLFSKEKTLPAPTVTTDSISGNWKGEETINKIVIMRGGRGFIIFKNGASMNISIKIEKEDDKSAVIISQNGSNNASFYPELDRKTALESAVEAEPIEWKLFLQEDGSLKGEKKTLVQKDDSVEQGFISVEWKKSN